MVNQHLGNQAWDIVRRQLKGHFLPEDFGDKNIRELAHAYDKYKRLHLNHKFAREGPVPANFVLGNLDVWNQFQKNSTHS
jgi:hypothetical protein